MTSPDWRTLNAYVDGELGSREAAEVAHAAGHDPETAEQISLLYHVKGGVHEIFPSAPDGLVSVLPRRRRRYPMLAAAALAAAVGAAAMMLPVPAGTPTLELRESVFDSARAMHDRWLVHEMTDAVDTPPVVLAALSRFGRLPVVPDLESTGLSVGLVKVSDLQGGRVLQIGYRGQHGCHLSLFVFAGDQLPVSGIHALDRTERAHAWRVEDLGYLLFAKGMDESRFSLISQKVEHATRVNAPLDERARQELAQNKRNSANCEA